MGALHYPSTGPRSKKFPASLRSLSSPPEVALEPVRVEHHFDLRIVVPLIETDPLASPPRWTERSGFQCSLDQLAVISVRRSDENPERHSSTVGQQAALDPRLPSVRRVRPPAFATERRFGHGAVHRLPAPSNASLVVLKLEGLLPYDLEDPGGAPLLKPIVDGALRIKAPRQGAPLSSGTEQVEDPGETLPIVRSRSAPSR